MPSAEDFPSIRKERTKLVSSFRERGFGEESGFGEVELACYELLLGCAQVGGCVVDNRERVAFECCGGEDVYDDERKSCHFEIESFSTFLIDAEYASL